MKPVLSISLLCSGREETKKCLDSLKPIMEQIESELIIVDTGCDDEMKQLLSEYTSHIIPFTWCDDFSAARNAGLKEAKGEWFLYIDDDEYFRDVQDIVDFFQSGEYRKYGQACYVQRNYTDYTGKNYQDQYTSRMIKIRPDTRFVDRIHEYLAPVHGENKLLNSWVDHYGYIYASLEDKRKHEERNVSLLKNTIEENKMHLRARAHLAQEYLGIPDYEKMAELCKESVDLLKNKKKDIYYDSYRQTFYLGTMLALMNLEKFDEAEKFFPDAASDKKNDELGRAGLCQLGADVYYRKKNYEVCDKCCREYIRVYKKMEGALNYVPVSPIFVQNIFFNNNRNNLFCVYICSRLDQGDTKALKTYFFELGWEDNNFGLYEGILASIMNAMSSMPYDEDFLPIAQKLIEDERVQELTIDEIKMQIREKGDAALYPLAKIFGQVNIDHSYILYLKVMSAAHENRREEVEEAYPRLFRKFVDVLAFEDRVFDIADEYGLDMDAVIAGISFEQWQKGVDSFCERNPMDVVWKKREFIEKHCKAGSSRYDYLMLKVSEVEAVISTEYKDYTLIRNVMKNFSDMSFTFYERYFRPEAFEGEMEMLPLPCRVAVRLRRVLQAEAAGDIAKFREELTGCIGIFGPINDAIQYFGKMYAARREQELAESRRVSDEMQSLARQVKKQLCNFLARGDRKTAYSIWQQLHALTPDDPELAVLERQCRE